MTQDLCVGTRPILVTVDGPPTPQRKDVGRSVSTGEEPVSLNIFTLKVPNKNCSRRHYNFLILSLEENKA